MKLFISTLFLVLTIIAPASYADDDGKLFINLTSDDPWRSDMALVFANANLNQGHTVTVFLNVKGVHLAAKTPPPESSKNGAELIAKLLANGGQVIICPMCMKRAGLTAADLIDGITMGGPAVTFKAMYASDVQMSY